MPRYVIERQYLVPMFEHILVEAPSFDAACREAIDEFAQPWVITWNRILTMPAP
jgi:hypothetical protein